jgi:dUTP pyrophosphatase
VTVLDAPGTIDADYRGETAVLLINHGEGAFTIHHGDRIAQLLICPVVQVEPIVVAALGETTRGEGGYRHRG